MGVINSKSDPKRSSCSSSGTLLLLLLLSFSVSQIQCLTTLLSSPRPRINKTPLRMKICNGGAVFGTTLSRTATRTATTATTLLPPVYLSSRRRRRLYEKNKTILHAASPDSIENVKDDDELLLLRINFSTTKTTTTTAIENIRTHLRKVPYAALLPVQPLTFRPTDRGIDVTFLRKKTAEKGSADGGLIFLVEDDEKEKGRVQLTVRRNPTGQTVPKVFSEKIVILAIVKDFVGEDGDEMEVREDWGVTVDSIFHRWM